MSAAVKTAAMTTGERMKAIRFYDEGWSESEIAARLNRKRRHGYLNHKNLPELQANHIAEWVDFFKRRQISA